ncbi:MAG: hypothetical protein KBE04_00290 [Phycisphaerae bacterium]|nr:hypothetical protein [Phycisphaerae bacterium]
MLEGLPAEVGPLLEGFCKRLQALLKDDLQSLTVVGSCVSGDFLPGVSDVNTLVLLSELHQGSLAGLAGLVKAFRRHRVCAPWVMTEACLERSRRVFGVEWLDFQAQHLTLVGMDPLVGLTFEKADVRLQCERELQATLVRLREGLIAAGLDRAAVRGLLIRAAKSLLPVLRAMLWQVDLERPPGRGPTCGQAWEAFGVQMQGVLSVLKWHEQGCRVSARDLEVAFDSVYAAVDQLAYLVDELEV